jgi:hypothetical protein
MNALATIPAVPTSTLTWSTPVSERPKSWRHHIGLGLLTGAGIGVTARGFMRLLAGEPEFTWSGTLLIVGLFTVFGTMQGIVAGVRSRTSRHWITAPARVLGGLSYLLLGGGAGALMVPFLWTMAPAIWRPGWNRLVRVGLAAVAALNVGGVIVMQFSEQEFRPTHLLGLGLLILVYLATAWTAGPTFRQRTALE